MMMDAERVKACALELGFVACGITDPSPTAHGDRLDEWLARGYAGTMRYLHRQAARRKDPRRIAPEVKSVVVVLDNYYQPDTAEDLRPPKLAKYARGRDYHQATMERLEQLAERLRREGASYARCFTDAGPVPERELAQRAGLGWIGKNTMLLRPGVGSFFFIGSVFTDLALAPDPPFTLDRCGSCTRCLDACPTEAFIEPRLLDATRCISYLTIEQKGPIPDELAPRLEGWAFGCDICNDVCPWNQRFAAPSAVADFAPRGHLRGADANTFERMDEDEFARRFGDTPLERPGLAGMRRNVRAALGTHSFPANPSAPASMSEPVVTIRSAAITQAPVLAEFAVRTFRDAYGAMVPAEDMELHLERRYSPAFQAAEVADARNSYLVAEVGGALAGYALIRHGRGPGDEPVLHAPTELARFYVAREWHGRGVAQQLMAAVMAEAKQRGSETLWLTVWTENPRAVAFYRKQGFVMAGTAAFQLGSQLQEDFLMTFDLAAAAAPSRAAAPAPAAR